MELKINDLIALLNINEKTLFQWIRDKKIPNYKINHQYLFNKTEIKEWVLQNNIQVSDKILELNETNTPVKLSQLIGRGGIYFNVTGKTPIEVIKNAVQVMTIPPEVDEETVVYSLIEREEMMPTAIGKGVAVPHPRNPIIADIDHENVTLCLLHEAINYNALDNEPVHAIFIILSANPKRHLQILAHISYLCQKDDFPGYLRQKHTAEEILFWIQEKESRWERKPH